ncbi:MAG: 2-oxoacid:acceptor oxidoreductase subunit alpha [Deltaproteobacteria bacterium]|nr:2-oxoacid:acceptor oxidoreductase subunit alpha [Deltaproteobacteria bacterium]MBW2307887.1 2-oxoacid:acceptor oxidoreductase subunit alpha [Deltaproteobacteria bacterium]
MPKERNEHPTLMQGNEAVVDGALAAGCSFFAGYPITPASEIAERFSLKMPRVGGTFIQMEDEIASMGAIIGASLAGVKAMTATSGPGFSLMQENLGFACIAEAPVVVANVMRGGPSTGLPTSPSQGDVQQARWGTHGDHTIIALTPSSVKECYTLTVRAFNLSEKYRVPVILLMDEVIAHMREKVVIPSPESLEVFDRVRPTVPPDWYIPYEDTPWGVPPMAPFGHGYRYHVTGLVHDPRGFPTARPDEIIPLMNRLQRKIDQHLEDIQTWESFMTEDATLTVVAYGCVARSARRAVVEAREKGIRAGLLRPVTIWPFCNKALEEVLRSSSVLLVPEMNQGQLVLEVLRANQGQVRVFTLNRVDGNIITPEEILQRIEEVV